MLINRKKLPVLAVLFSLVILPSVCPAAEQVTVGFSPGGSAQAAVLDVIAQARESIDLAAYYLTSKSTAQALAEAAERGVSVRVVADKKANGSRYTAATWLARHGIPVRVNGHYDIMHNKFMIIDGRTVETGSFNYTASADKRNAENVIVLRDMPDAAQPYAREFERLWNESEPLNSGL
ncbi:phospholipase D family protein [Escherichia coli]|uniref:phospholipase D family nuclease n=1 Tax=Escherichia coli TaxID=562 RepID=UPI001F5B3E4A|nr:phospholipase D family protein [Escherichia coli]MCI3086762.1 phospholipase D family protein [Escherichia coli]